MRKTKYKPQLTSMTVNHIHRLPWALSKSGPDCTYNVNKSTGITDAIGHNSCNEQILQTFLTYRKLYTAHKIKFTLR
jgi:hypothetical protein